jgi:hypothetical protein
MKRQKNSLRTWTNPVNLSLKEGEGEGVTEGDSFASAAGYRVDKSKSIREGEG